MGEAAGSDKRDPLGLRIARFSQGLTELPGALQRRQWRPLAVDVGGNHRQVIAWRQEVKRNHDAVVEFPLLRVAHIDVFQNGPDQARCKIGISGNTGPGDTQPLLFFHRPLVAFGHSHAIGRHVVHEEIGEMLGGHHHQRIRARVFQLSAHDVHVRIKPFAQALLGALITSGNTRRVTANAGEHEAHCSVMAYRPPRTGPCLSTPSRIALRYSFHS